MGEFDTDVGVVTDESTAKSGSIGAERADVSTGGDDRGADQDFGNQPWHKDPRFREFNSEYKDWKANKGRVSEYEAELNRWRNGEHEQQRQWAERLVQERDRVWEEAAKGSGVDGALRRYWQAVQSGGAAAGAEQVATAEPEWRKELQGVQAKVEQFERERLRETLDRDFNNAVTEIAPYINRDAKAKSALEALTTRLAASDLDDNRQMRKPLGHYVKEAHEMLAAAYQARVQDAAERRKAPPTGPVPGAGLPPGKNRRDQLEAAKNEWITRAMAAREE